MKRKRKLKYKKVITDEDKQYYYKNRRFDNEAWEQIQKILSEESKKTL